MKDDNELNKVAKESINLTNLVNEHLHEYLGEEGTLNTLTSITNLLLDFGYTIFYSITEEESKRLNLSKPAIQLKDGNHGSYWYTEDHTGDSFLTANISLHGKRTELTIPFKEITHITVLMDNLAICDLSAIFAYVNKIKYANLFLKEPIRNPVVEVASYDKPPKKEPTPKSSAKVVQLFPNKH